MGAGAGAGKAGAAGSSGGGGGSAKKKHTYREDTFELDSSYRWAAWWLWGKWIEGMGLAG